MEIRKAFLLICLAWFISGAAGASCQELEKVGDPAEKVDLLLVGGENYSDKKKMLEDFRYFVDTDNRGLFDVYPMNVTTERFNLWYAWGRNGSSTTDGDRGPFREARYWRESCGTDLAVFMGKESYSGWRAGALAKEARVGGVAEKVEKGNGAVGLIHEWGHLFGKVADEYNYGSGKKPASKPNCAYNKSQAERWWGEMASLTPRVGYEKGCKGSENIEAHPGKSIMGDGGHWHYGPVNDRRFLRKITKKTGTVTDLSIGRYSVSNSTLEVELEWEKASNVALLNVSGRTVEKSFIHGSGSRNLTVEVEDSDSRVSVDTVRQVKETNSRNNLVEIRTEEKVLNLTEGWNLISVPREVSTGYLQERCELGTSGENAVWSFKDGWNRPDKLETMLGYYVYSEENCSLKLDSGDLNDSLSIPNGWNIISVTPEARTSGLEDCSFSSEGGKFWNWKKRSWKVMETTEDLLPVKGYFAYAEEECRLG